jgi:MHS family proline/betaine transporter-like MFS transporter
MRCASWINTFNTFVFALFVPVSGWFSDKVGRRTVMLPAMIVLGIVSYPIFILLSQGFWGVLWGQFILMALLGILFGPLPALLVELFPLKIRYTGLSMVHSLAMSIFGGTAPFVMTHFINATNDLLMPAYYLIGSALLSGTALFFYQDRFKESID